eukprot:gb/GECH01014994.1/.p1 GENE.gb/GECH01014994.1/~~gb/GECH01014994.1/.p1  ORF type:complete len:134 (+),score=48.23 gb/GECH01014994.1/:1-402(+)
MIPPKKRNAPGTPVKSPQFKRKKTNKFEEKCVGTKQNKTVSTFLDEEKSQLKNKIIAAKNEKEELKNSIHKSGSENELDELNQLSEKWLSAVQSMLEELQSKPAQEVSITQILSAFQINPKLVKYDIESESFM